MRLSKLLLFICLLVQSSLFGQSVGSFRNVSINANFSKGFIYAHHQSFKYFIKNYVPACDLSIGKKTNGTRLWHQLYNFPTVGLGYSYYDLGDPEQLGNANSIFTYISMPLMEKKYVKLALKSAAGVAWLSERFDLYTNKYNIAIGSNINAYLNLRFEADIRMFPKIYFVTGFGLTHYSNGGTRQPNKGFNILSLQAGLKYQFNENQQVNRLDSLLKYEKRNEFSIIYAGGVKTLEPARSKQYYVSAFSFCFERQFTHKSRLGIGLDLFNDQSRKEYLIAEGIESPSGTDLYYSGGHISYDLVFGKTSFTIQMGAYLWQRSKHFEQVYHRFGLKYRFTNHLIANLTLKTFWAAADFAEWGIGYRF